MSGNKSENHHYVITVGITSKSHSYVSGIFNKTLSKGNGLLISVGMHDNTTKASVIATNIYHDVTFNTNGSDSMISDQSVFSNELAIKPSDPTRTSFVFEGWYEASNLSQLFDFQTPITSDITLYAKWGVSSPVNNNVPLSFDSNGGSTVASQTLVQCDSASKPSDPTRSGYTFNAWNSDASLQTPFEFSSSLNSDTTVYAKWNEVKAKIESDVLPSTGYQNSAPIIAISIVVLGGMILIARKRNK